MEDKVSYILIEDDSDYENDLQDREFLQALADTNDSATGDFGLRTDETISAQRLKLILDDINDFGDESFADLNSPEDRQPLSAMDKHVPSEELKSKHLPLDGPPISIDSKLSTFDKLERHFSRDLPQNRSYAIPLPNFQVSKSDDPTKSSTNFNAIFEKSVRQKFDMFLKAVGLSTMKVNHLLTEFVELSRKNEFPAEPSFLLPDYKYIETRMENQELSTDLDVLPPIDDDEHKPETPIQFFIVSDDTESSISHDEDGDVIMLNS